MQSPAGRRSRPHVALIRPRECTGVTEFSLGLGYIARMFLNAGFEVTTLCRDLTNDPTAIFREKLRATDADLFAIGGMYGSYPDFIEICGLIREVCPGRPIVLGGALPTSEPEHVMMKTGADYVCIGPSDDTVIELAQALVGDGDARDIHGLCLRDGSGFLRTHIRAQPRFLDPGRDSWPAWELFDGAAYTRGTMYYPFTADDVAAPILTARGCPYSCNFCFQPMAYARRQLDDVFDEMEWLIDRYGVNAFYIEDDLFMLDRKRVLAFCNGVHTRNLRIKFTATARFNIVDRALLVALKEAGCVTLFYGGEATDDDILEQMKKKITVDQMRDGIAQTRDVGLFARIGFMFGQPGETSRHLDATVRFLKEIAYANFEPRLIYGCIPFPGTDLFKHCLSHDLLADEEDFYNRFRFQKRLLDQMPANMTAIRNADPMDLLRRANAELLAYYQDKAPQWIQSLNSELTAA
ncbi:B12-binding domain-containing radical SAM protein [Bradyrhizobium sp. HKCCYLS3013]|uniref:B12-binding domain-containing radical SAM protein n=1 Tax=Bradyrhizobium sp. HKCCYLS3013 TaxID=3420735 RepID=UPI003EC0209A